MRPVQCVAVASILACAALTASAQPILSAKSGVVAGVEGKVLIDKQEVQSSATHFPEVKENSVLSTEEGRVELMLPPGFMLRMGENGSLKMLSTRLIDTRLEMQAGSAVIEVEQGNPDYSVAVAIKDVVVTLTKAGVYRFDTEPARLKVFNGNASVQFANQLVMVGSAKMISLDGDSASAEKFDITQTDALDNWSRRRSEAMALANISGAKYNGQQTSAKSGGSWSWNPYFGMYTYIPMYGRYCNPFYNVCYYSPMAAYNTFYAQPVYTMPASTMGSAATPNYTQMSGTSTGTASSVSSAPHTVSSSSPSMSSSSSTAASASSASSGHGSAAGGGRGH